MKYARTSSTLLALVAASLLASGCIITTDQPLPFSPFGGEVTVSGQWSVNGAAPTVSSCGDLVTVRALVCETATGTNCVPSAQLTFSCQTGSFDTRPTPLLASGTYYIVWEALNSSGVRVQASSPTRLDAYGSHAVLPSPDFAPGTSVFDPSGTAVSLNGSWTVNGAAPTVASCGNIARVRVAICQTSAATDCWSTPSLSFPCASGAFDTRPTRVLAAGSYHSLWEALDASGNVLQESTALPLVVSGHATLATPNFIGTLPPTSATVQVRFANPTGGSFVACSTAMTSGSQFSYSLHEGSTVNDPTIVATTNQACSIGSDVIFTENAGFMFDADPYTLQVNSQEVVGGQCRSWSGACTFSLTLNASNLVTCNASLNISPAPCK